MRRDSLQRIAFAYRNLIVTNASQ